MDPTVDLGGKCKVTFKFIPCITLPSTEADIFVVAQNSRDIFLGTKNGTLLKYRIRKHLHRDGNISYINRLQRSVVVNAGKPITQIFVVTGNINNVICLCGGIITLYKTKDLTKVDQVPVRGNVDLIATNDGSPYYGMAANIGKRLFLYDLHYGFKAYKAVNLPEQPRTITWIRKHLCIGFRKHYSIIGTEKAPQLLCSVTNLPVTIAMPFEEIAVAFKKKTVFGYATARKSRESLEWDNVPMQFAFCYPFIINHCTDSIEIRSVVDPVYHEVLRKPSGNFLRSIVSDGKDIVATEGKQVYVLAPDSTNYWVADPEMLREVRKNPADKILFIRYVNLLLREFPNPFFILLDQYGDTFVQKFPNPEEVEYKVVKKDIKKTLRKVYNVILSYFTHFKLRTWRQLLCGVLQSAFYNKIYWTVYAMITCKYKQQDLDYMEELDKYRHYTPADMGVAKQFWLMEQSLEDPPKKKAVDTLDKNYRAHRKSDPKKPTVNETTDPDEEEPDYDYAVFIVSEGGSVRLDVPYVPRKSAGGGGVETTTTKPKARRFSNVSDALRDVIDDAPTINLSVEAELYELIDPLSGSKKLGEGELSVNTKNQVQIQLKNNLVTGPFIIRPNKQFSFSSNSMSISWQQKEKHYKLIFEEEYDYDTAFEQLNIWQNSLASEEPSEQEESPAAILREPSPMKKRLSSKQQSSQPKQPQPQQQEPNTSDHLDPLRYTVGGEDSYSINPSKSEAEEPVVNHPTPTPKKTKVSRQLDRSNDSKSASGSPAPSRSLKQSGEFGDPLQHQEIGLSESPLTAAPALPPRLSKSKLGSVQIENEPTSSSLPTRSLFDSEDSEEDKDNKEHTPELGTGTPGLTTSDILTFDHEPYRRAIQSLKKLSSLKSPRDKLGCILITFMDIIQCVTDFWEVHDREPVVGADDLVPIFSYVILKARVPKLYSEMSYIWEFATDAEMKGKYGYGFATFQIGVEVVARLSIDELERKQKLASPPKPPKPAALSSDDPETVPSTSPELQFEERETHTPAIPIRPHEHSPKLPFAEHKQTSGSDVDIPFCPTEFEPRSPPSDNDQPKEVKDLTESQSESSWEFVSREAPS